MPFSYASPLFPFPPFSSFLRSSHFDDVPYGSLSSLGWGLQFVLLLPLRRFLHRPSHRLGSTVCLCVLCVCDTPAVCVLGFFVPFFLFFSFIFIFTIIVVSFIVLVKPRSNSCLWGSEVIRLCMLLCCMSSFRCSFSFLRFPRYCCTWRTLLASLVLFLRGDGRWVPLGLLQFLSPHILL